MSRHVMFSVIDDFLSLLFPRLCQACGEHLVRNERVVCIDCLADMPATGFHQVEGNDLEKELWGRCYCERVAAMFYYRRGSRIQKLVHRLKYNGITEIGEYFGEMYGRRLEGTPFLEGVDALVPVPLHPARERQRGFNQSLVIASSISSATGIPVITGALVRTRRSETQTRRGRVERWENVSEIFSITGKPDLGGMHILLVDDVITTGSTVEACVNALKKAPGIRVSVAALAAAL